MFDVISWWYPIICSLYPFAGYGLLWRAGVITTVSDRPECTVYISVLEEL